MIVGKREKMKSREQELIDIIFEVGLTIADSSYKFKSMSKEEIAAWITKQLSGCGFETKPIGSSWGVLINNTDTNPLKK